MSNNPDNSQAELDEILRMLENELAWPNIDKQYAHLGAVDVGEAKQAIINWHNKQVEAVLDRLEKEINTGRTFTNDYVISEAIQSERDRIKKGTE